MSTIPRVRRTRILVEGNPELRQALAAGVRREYAVVEPVPPEPGLIMTKMRETAKNSLFYIGEVLATEAKVRVEGHGGLGLVLGNHPEAARDLAIIDAAYNAKLSICDDWTPLLDAEEERLARQNRRNLERLLETRVEFQRMQIETDDAP
jgi:alpha-D-ribose 1-methylphosphonate 5-triphosphate synthase subunit PhnG